MSRNPDFIIIGAMKCATSTLHEQLAQQPGIFMSDPKEPNFFSDNDIYARGMECYCSLFQEAGPNDLCGESSTHYTKLPTHPQTLPRMREHVPEAKLIYVMRDPIDRLVSHYIHEWTQRGVRGSLAEAIDQHAALVDYSRYAMQLEPFLSTYGPGRVLPVFSERLRVEPSAELERVCRFLGYAGVPQWREMPPANVSAERMRRSAWREALRSLPGLRRAYRAVLPEAMRERINDLWRMKRRPELSPDQRRQLTKVFDEDLGRLGRWLGVELNCENFKRVVAERTYEWSDSAVRIPA